ncbi:DNA adenine methylase [Methanonatronarchaeum sp. AMET-Sl]|uniref:DNA adenine methylase n=1 Tax=Methanonatronarchaeum sp. AMET-Sl TaxID=3037654 RepID=UPI003263990A
MAVPVLKWAGGKREILDDLIARFPNNFNSYHEAFFGGGAVFFELSPEDGTINDTNTRLMNFYRQVRDNPKELIEVAKGFKHPRSDPDPDRGYSSAKNYYYQQRELFNRRPRGEDFDPLVEAALLLYLNRTCFNGLFRQNSKGEFNVPIGSYKNPDWVREKEVLEASKSLKNTKIYSRDFSFVVDVVEARDIVYFDPPYEPVSATANFTDYSADGFDFDDQVRLIDVLQELDEMDVFVVVSNSGVMRDRYEEAGFYVDLKGVSRSINCDASGRGEVDEVIATNVSPGERRGRRQKKLSDI